MKQRDVLLAAVALLIVWQVTAMIVNLSILPQPLEVLRVLSRELRRDMLIHVAVSLWRVTAGMLLSVLVAAPVGLAIGGSKRLNRFFSRSSICCIRSPKLSWCLLSSCFWESVMWQRSPSCF
jgi:NitT/TauT family transport system permease protein